MGKIIDNDSLYLNLGEIYKHKHFMLITIFSIILVAPSINPLYALVGLVVAFTFDFLTGIWASWFEYKELKEKGEHKVNKYFIESVKLRRSIAKANAYFILVISAFFIERIFLIKDFNLQISHAKFSITLVAIAVCFIVEAFSVLENMKRCGFDIIGSIRKVFASGYSVVKHLKVIQKNKILNDLLKVNGKYAKTPVLLFLSFIWGFIIGNAIVIANFFNNSEHRSALSVFDSIMVLVFGLSGVTVANKFAPKRDAEPTPPDQTVQEISKDNQEIQRIIMDQVSLERIETLHPAMRDKARNAYIYINNKLFGKRVRLRLAYCRRSKEEQTSLYAQGRTVLFDSKGNRLGKVTNAQWWQTIHFYGLAFDIVVLYDMDNNGTFEVASWDLIKDIDADGYPDWKEAVDYLKSQGFEWGGDWRFKDAPHFQYTFGYTWQKLYEKYKASDFIPAQLI